MTLRLLLLAVFVVIPFSVFANLPEDVGGMEMIPYRKVGSGVRRTAIQTRTADEDQTPAALRWMIAPIKRGMFVRIPVIDTDPNRGVTYGIMPIVVLQGKNDDRISMIHAPSLTYNKNFKLTPTYRLYYYPHEEATYVGRVSRGRYEHEIVSQYEDHRFLGSPYDVVAHFKKERDAGERFFGIGPNTPKSNETNFVQDSWQFRWGAGLPILDSNYWRIQFSQHYSSSRILNGPLPGLPTMSSVFPKNYSNNTQQTFESRLSLDFDSRDHANTPNRGVYFLTFAEASVKNFISQYDYRRYGINTRWFCPWKNNSGNVFAIQGNYEQLLGQQPAFWILPSLGGKYSLRAYGEGRYVDRGMATVNIEQRLKLYEAKTAGVTTELQLAPFIEAGTVFNTPQSASSKYIRNVVGVAIRAVAKPQVVGSVDFGIGREGLSIFTDINYSF